MTVVMASVARNPLESLVEHRHPGDEMERTSACSATPCAGTERSSGAKLRSRPRGVALYPILNPDEPPY